MAGEVLDLLLVLHHPGLHGDLRVLEPRVGDRSHVGGTSRYWVCPQLLAAVPVPELEDLGGSVTQEVAVDIGLPGVHPQSGHGVVTGPHDQDELLLILQEWVDVRPLRHPVHRDVEDGLEGGGVSLLPVLLDWRAAPEPLLVEGLPGGQGDLEQAVDPELEVAVLVLADVKLSEEAEGGELELFATRVLAERAALEVPPEDSQNVGHGLVGVAAAELVHLPESVVLGP